jgi:rubrerythrin
VKKGSSPKSAPTYIEEKSTAKLAYRCKICGYIYEGDITKEPDTYVCPICKKGKEFFEKI